VDDPFVVRYPEIWIAVNWHFSKLMQQSESVVVEHENEILTMPQCRHSIWNKTCMGFVMRKGSTEGNSTTCFLLPCPETEEQEGKPPLNYHSQHSQR